MRSLVLFLVFSLGFSMQSTLMAQLKAHIGATTAVNSSFVLDQGLKEDPRYQSISNYQWAPIGLAFGVDFNPGFGLQIESIFASQGQVYQVIDVAKTVVGERKIDLEYVHLPLMLKFMSKKNTKARVNAGIGPQLSILTQGIETLEYAASTQDIPEGVTPPEGAIPNADGTYDVPALSSTILSSTGTQTEFEKFKASELQIAGSIGVDIDLAKNIYFSGVLRANYGITDMRNSDLLDRIKSKDDQIGDIFGRRANLLIGLQFGVHYMFGGVRSL